jgi:hypothetical protein
VLRSASARSLERGPQDKDHAISQKLNAAIALIGIECALISMMARSTTRSNERPDTDTSMQDRICQVDETSCNARLCLKRASNGTSDGLVVPNSPCAPPISWPLARQSFVHRDALKAVISQNKAAQYFFHVADILEPGLDTGRNAV